MSCQGESSGGELRGRGGRGEVGGARWGACRLLLVARREVEELLLRRLELEDGARDHLD